MALFENLAHIAGKETALVEEESFQRIKRFMLDALRGEDIATWKRNSPSASFRA